MKKNAYHTQDEIVESCCWLVKQSSSDFCLGLMAVVFCRVSLWKARKTSRRSWANSCCSVSSSQPCLHSGQVHVCTFRSASPNYSLNLQSGHLLVSPPKISAEIKTFLLSLSLEDFIMFMLLCSHLCLCQRWGYATVLCCPSAGGHFVCKSFDLFTPFSVGLVYLLYLCFDRICLFKPVTSRPANSERWGHVHVCVRCVLEDPCSYLSILVITYNYLFRRSKTIVILL